MHCMKICLTVGELREALLGYPDDMRIVTDGYEGNYDDVIVSPPFDVNLNDRYEDYLGAHTAVYFQGRKDHVVSCINLGRKVVSIF